MRVVVAFAAATLAVALAKPFHGESPHYEGEHPPRHDFLPPPVRPPPPGHPTTPYSDAPHSAVTEEPHAPGEAHGDQMHTDHVLKPRGGHHKEEDLQKHSHPAKSVIPPSPPSAPQAVAHGILKEHIADAHEAHLPSGHLSKSRKGRHEKKVSSEEGHHKEKHHGKEAHDVTTKRLPPHAEHHSAQPPFHHIAKDEKDHHREALSKDGHRKGASSSNELHHEDRHHRKEAHDVVTREHSASHDTHRAHLPFDHASKPNEGHHERKSLKMDPHHKERAHQMRPHDLTPRKGKGHAAEPQEAHHEKVASPKEGLHKQTLQTNIYNVTYNIYKHKHYNYKEKKHEEQSRHAAAKEIHPSADAHGAQHPSSDHASKLKEDHFKEESPSKKGHHKDSSSEKERQKEREEKMKEKKEKEKDKHKEKKDKEKEKKKDKEKENVKKEKDEKQKQKQSMDVTTKETPAPADGYGAQLPYHASVPKKEHEPKSKENHDKEEGHQKEPKDGHLKEQKEDHRKDASSSFKGSYPTEKDRQKHSHFTLPPHTPINDAPSPSDVYVPA